MLKTGNSRPAVVERWLVQHRGVVSTLAVAETSTTRKRVCASQAENPSLARRAGETFRRKRACVVRGPALAAGLTRNTQFRDYAPCRRLGKIAGCGKLLFSALTTLARSIPRLVTRRHGEKK
jgi:hypothetical protein